MTDVIRIISEAEFIEGSLTPTNIHTPLQNARKTETSLNLTSEVPLSILDHNYQQPDTTSKESPELEVLYFKPSREHLPHPKLRTRRNVERPPGYEALDPYDQLISSCLLVLKHLDFIRNCISKVKDVLEEPCPGHEDEFPPVTSLRAWKYVVEYGIHCLGKPRPAEDLSRKIVKRQLKRALCFTVAEVDRCLVLAQEFLKNLNAIEKQVDVIQALAARILKENLKSAETSKSKTPRALDQHSAEDSPSQTSSPTQSTTAVPQNFITRRNLLIQSGIDGISVKTGSRRFWIKLLTVSLPHKLNFLSVFLTQLSKFGKESEVLLKSAQNLLMNSDISEPSEPNSIFTKIKSSTEISSVQTLVQQIPALLKSKKKKFTPKEQVMALRICWRLGEDFAKAKAELIAVTETMTVYRDEVKGLFKKRNSVLKGSVIYFEASEKFQLLVENIGDGLDLGKLFDAYSTYGIPDTEDDLESDSVNQFEHKNLDVESEISTFTVIDSTRTLNGRIAIPETMTNSELGVPLAAIKLEYETAFNRVKSCGTLTDPDILLCSDTVKLFLENCARLITTLSTHSETLRTSLTGLESDSYKQFPGVLVWMHLLVKMLLITNFSWTTKESLAKDLMTLFQIQEQTEASLLQHENSLHEFHYYLLEVIRKLRARDAELTKICDEVIEKDHFSNMLSYTEQKLILPNINLERDEFSIRISFIKDQCKIFSIPASGSTEGTRIVKFSILDKRTTASLLMETMEFIGNLLTSTTSHLETGIHILAKHGIARTLNSTEIKNLSKLEPFEKLAILIALKSVLSSLAQTFVVFRELRLITQQLNFVFEGFQLLLQFEDFPIPSTDTMNLATVPEAIPYELKAQFLSFSIYHYLPSENHELMRLVEDFHRQHGMTLTEVVRHEDKNWGFGLASQEASLSDKTKLAEYKGLARPDSPPPLAVTAETPKPAEKLYRKIPLGLFLQEMPRIIDSVIEESKKIPKPPITPIQIDNRMTNFFNVFTTWLQSKIFKSVQSLHLPKASIYIEKVSETRPIVGQLEALCFFIGLASTQLNSKSLPVESRVYNKLRPKFLEFTNALVAFQNTRKDICAWIGKRVDTILSSLEYENKEKLEQIHGEEVPGLEELHSLCPIPPPDLATSIWNTGMAIKSVQKEIPDDKLMIFHWNVWRHDVLEVEYKTHADIFEYSGMTFRTRGKLLDYMMDQALNVLNKSLTFLKNSKFDITEAGRVVTKLKEYLQELDEGCHVRPEQTYVILRTLRARIVGVYMYLDRTESILKRCRFFLSHGIRHIRAHLHEVDSFNRDFGDNPFHYLSLRVELELLQPMNIIRHHDASEVEIISSSAAAPQETGPIGDQIQDHARTMLKFFESFGNEVHRLGTLMVSGLQITYSCISSPSAEDKTTEPSVPKIVGLSILIGQVMIEIRTYNELLAKEHNFMSIVQEVENCADQFPIRSSKIFGKTPKAKLMEAIESTEETIAKIASYLKAPFNMAGGLEPNVTVRENIDTQLLELSNTDLDEGSEAQIWTLRVTDSTSKLILRHEATSEQVKFGDLSTLKQVGILKLLFQTLKEAFLTASKTLETTGIDSVKDAGARLKLVKSSLKTFLKANPPNTDEFFDLTTILDDLHFSMELVKGTWSQMNLEIKAVSKILTCASAYMRLRFTTAGIKSTTTYLHSSAKSPHPHKRAGAAAMTFKEGQIQKRYTSKVSEVEEHLRGFIVTPLAIPLKLHLATHAQKK